MKISVSKEKLCVRVLVDYADTRFSNFVNEYLRENKKVRETVLLFIWGPGRILSNEGGQKSRDTVPLTNPLKTTKNIFSDFSENFTSDSLYFLKLKGFCVNFIFLQWLPRKNFFSFFEFFDSVDLFFMQFLSMLLNSLSLIPGTRICQHFCDTFNRLGNITKSVFIFFNSAPLQCTVFLRKIRVFET